MLNGETVDPLQTPNPLDFMLLSIVMTEQSNALTFASHEYWEGKVGEIIIWDRPLTSAQTKGVHAFLYEKWISLADLESSRTAVEWGSISTNTAEIVPSRQLRLHPNPTSGLVQIQATGLQVWQLNIFDLQGRMLWQQKGSGNMISVDMSTFENGIYLVQLRDQESGHVLRKRVVKSR